MTDNPPNKDRKQRHKRKSLKQQMAERTAQLEESVAHFRLLTENVSDVVWKHDPDGFFTYISPADERLRGYRADEVIGHHVFELMTEESVAAVTEKIRMRQETKVPVESVTFEAQLRCKDGSLVWTEIITTPEIDEHGAVTDSLEEVAVLFGFPARRKFSPPVGDGFKYLRHHVFRL
jgi:PAS domain S-box-containing protein